MHSHSPSVRPIRCLYARLRAGGLDKIAAIEQHGQGAVTDDFGEDDKSPGGRFSDQHLVRCWDRLAYGQSHEEREREKSPMNCPTTFWFPLGTPWGVQVEI